MSETRYCEDCAKPKKHGYTPEWNGVFGPGGTQEPVEWETSGVKRELVKICPLGTDVGGFLWQCPECKRVYADWEEG